MGSFCRISGTGLLAIVGAMTWRMRASTDETFLRTRNSTQTEFLRRLVSPGCEEPVHGFKQLVQIERLRPIGMRGQKPVAPKMAFRRGKGNGRRRQPGRAGWRSPAPEENLADGPRHEPAAVDVRGQSRAPQCRFRQAQWKRPFHSQNVRHYLSIPARIGQSRLRGPRLGGNGPRSCRLGPRSGVCIR